MTYHSKKLIFEDKLIFGVLGASLVMNLGFSMLRFPSSLPLTESVLMLCLIGYVFRTSVGRLWLKSPLFIFVVFWWLFAGITIFNAYPTWGVFSFRSATHVVEIAFLLPGIFMGSSYNKRKIFFAFFGTCLLLGNIHILLSPFSDYLRPYSPSVISLVGETTYLLFNFNDINSAIHFPLLPASYLAWLIFTKKSIRKWDLKLFICILAIGFTLAKGQARTNYLIYPILFIMVFLFDRKHIRIILGIFCIAVFFLIIVSIGGIQIQGRIGTFNIEFLYRHFLAAFGMVDDHAIQSIAGAAEESIAGAAEGVNQRLSWWDAIIRQLFNDPTSLLFGLGQGVPLTTLFLSDGTPVREPHNSVMSIFGRYGLLGLGVFIWMHLVMITKLLRNMRFFRNTSAYSEYLFLIFFLLATFIITMVEDALEKPYCAVWYYFVWGMAITRSQHQ